MMTHCSFPYPLAKVCLLINGILCIENWPDAVDFSGRCSNKVKKGHILKREIKLKQRYFKSHRLYRFMVVLNDSIGGVMQLVVMR